MDTAAVTPQLSDGTPSIFPGEPLDDGDEGGGGGGEGDDAISAPSALTNARRVLHPSWGQERESIEISPVTS